MKSFGANVVPVRDVLALQRSKRPFTVYLLTHGDTRRIVWARLMSEDAAIAECDALNDQGFAAVVDGDE